jgi:hypothetical protein
VNHYLYAIVERLPGRWRPPTTGVASAAVVPHRFDDLVVVTSLLETVPSASSRNLALHQDVVASLVDATATLPMTYGTAVPVTELPAWMAEHRATITAVLRGVRGCVEMTVKLLRLDGAIAQRLAGRAGSRAAGGPALAPDDGELQALAEALAERAGLPRWRYLASGNVAAAVAFLVPRTDLAGFLARIAPVASHAAGVAVVPTGPWVPHSFVPDLGRAARPRGRVGVLDVVDQRAG